MDVAYATMIRDHHSHDLVKHLQEKNFPAAQKCIKDIETLFEKIKDEITSGHAKTEKHSEGLTLQTLIFDKDYFRKPQVTAWLKKHDFKFDLDEKDHTFRARQIDPDDFDKDSFVTLDVEKGIKKVEGRLKVEQREEIPSDVIELMRQQIDDTARTGKENGFSLCNNKPLVAEPGSHNNIGLKKCPGLTLLFHTHPCNTPYPSDLDYNAAQGVEGLHKTCIGTQDGIHCYDPRTKQKLETLTA